MAIIEKLHILRFRNLDNQYLEPNTNINLFIGGNGQGKTNLIEALYYLGHSRSFKSKNIKDVVPFEKEFLQIDAVVDDVRVLLKKSKNKNTILFNQQKVSSNSELTHLMPTQIISPDRGFVVGGPPKLKRSYLDWGVFHVNPSILKTYKSYNKALKNTNALLTNNNTKQLDHWLDQIAKLSVEISSARADYIQKLKKTLKKTSFVPLKELIKQNNKFDFLLQSGWTKDTNHLDQESIYEYLIKNRGSFARIKHLNYGPHKANIDYYLNDQNEQHFSRGEQKKLSIFYWIIQVLMLVELNIKPIVLIDDISSELDQEKIDSILGFLSKLEVQIFITDIGNKPLPVDKRRATIYQIDKGLILKK
jgi:DNA replication and repair protein RecF